MCATHNVTASTQMIMTEEFKKGSEIVDRIIVGSADWSALFAKHDFFHKYRYYLQIIASTRSSDLQIKWSGTVESRIRQLVMKLEYVESLTLAHPFIKGFDQVHYCLTPEEIRAVAQGDVLEAVAKRKKEDVEGKEGATAVYTTSFYIGLAIEPKPTGSKGPRKLDISYPTTEFTKQVKMWEKYIEPEMGITVRHIKSTALPDYVFDEATQESRSRFVKDTDKSNGTSPDAPNKKRRLVQHPKANGHADSLVPLATHSASNSVSEPVVPTSQPLKTSQNGTIASVNPAATPATVEPTPPSNGIYTVNVKDPSQIKSPQLPFGENVAVATGVTPS
ncbi:hypothetical protein EVJ58_g1502 [Rhodofomes roseus]|uniref:polynucleotide adenylyltransferase n=1 Tax=Rhodofomes roseus TaxID=34475 RepID=A0A4Y9Z0W3_9APHY|nr:hypothetical protein EVJ58_g1502 [Rhodofomes roseus]